MLLLAELLCLLEVFICSILKLILRTYSEINLSKTITPVVKFDWTVMLYNYYNIPDKSLKFYSLEKWGTSSINILVHKIFIRVCHPYLHYTSKAKHIPCHIVFRHTSFTIQLFHCSTHRCLRTGPPSPLTLI